MSDWALYSSYSSDARYSGNSTTWSHPLTLNTYSNQLGTNGAPDTLLATTTQNISIPWRPVADPTCPDTGYGAGFAYRATDGQCYNGLAFNATFDMSSPNVTLFPPWLAPGHFRGRPERPSFRSERRADRRRRRCPGRALDELSPGLWRGREPT